MMEQATEIVDYVTRGGLAVFLILLIVGGAREWWVFGWTYRAVKEERDRYAAQVDQLMALEIKHSIDDAQKMDD
jgi:hypothetical protein